jgi:hypothetical protein
MRDIKGFASTQERLSRAGTETVGVQLTQWIEECVRRDWRDCRGEVRRGRRRRSECDGDGESKGRRSG